MGEVEVVNPLSGDGKLYRNMNLKLKSEKEEEKSLTLECQNKDKTLRIFASLYEVRVTECDESIENEKEKLRDSTSRQKLASAISLMSGEENLRRNVDDSKNTPKFHEKFLSPLLSARQRRGKVGTYFLTFVKAEPPDDEREKPVVTAMAPNKLLPSLERRRQAKNGKRSAPGET
jgi:hypothetical protein